MIIGTHSIIVIYEYFYCKKYLSPKYQFKPSSEALSRINGFIQALDKKYDIQTLGINFLSNYFIFQFNRTHNQIFKRFSSRFSDGGIKVGGRLQIYDIIGKKAFEYWLERDVKYDFILANSDFAKQHRISLLEIHDLLKVKETKKQFEILQSEEIEKKRFLNTSRGFLNCIEKTTLYNHRSHNCILCKSKNDCKKMLESNYPHIYKQRYETGSSTY